MRPRWMLVLSILLTGCSAAMRIVQPFGHDAPLPRASPESVGLDASILKNMSAQIAGKEKHELHSLLVVRKGQLVFEEYYNGHSRDTPHDIRSVTKSITSLLVGIAIEQGILAGVDQPVMDLLGASYPEVRDKDDLTIRHLLTMSSGLDCHDQDRRTRGQEDRMYRSKNWVQYFLTLSRVEEPGQRSRYCTGGVVALGEVLAQAAGQDAAAFATRVLFEPLGIRNYRWARFDGGTKVDTGGHLLITPQGLAKIGMLVLQEGRWDSKQVVSSEWIRLATHEQTRCDGNPYGFLWWIGVVPYGEKTVRVVSARGNGGQVIFVVPELDLVAVSTAGYYNSEKARIPYDLFFNAILPSVEEIRKSLPRRSE